MFREMLRGKQQLTDKECREILAAEPRGVLSVQGDDGYPYGLPIDYWYCPADGNLYFHCGKQGHKLDAIARCDKVSFCVYDQGFRREGEWALNIRSVIVFGRAQILTDHEKTLQIIRKMSLKYTQDTAYIEEEIRKYASGVLCICLTPEHITGKIVNEA